MVIRPLVASTIVRGATIQISEVTAAMTQQTAFTAYVGQVERDSDGQIWAVLYCEGRLIAREQTRSLRRGKRRITDMLLAAADVSAVPVMAAAPADGELGRLGHQASPERAGWHSGGGWRPLHLI